MLQYEYKSVYFVCRKPKLSVGTIVMSAAENDIHENGYDFSEIPAEEEEIEKEVVDDTKNTCSDNDDDHEVETN